MNWKQVQDELKSRGFDPGPIDGIPGTLTDRAIRAFQAANHLSVDGIVGPQTLAQLQVQPGQPPVPVVPASSNTKLVLPWMELLNEYKRRGVDERGDTAEIAEWASKLGLGRFDARSTPWCGLTEGNIMSVSLRDEPLPSNVLGARNWLQFGVKCEPQYGAVLVFWRTNPNPRISFNGHVGNYVGERSDAFLVRGGNESDAVGDAWVSKARLLGARWPKTAPFLATGAVHVDGGGSVSHDEA